MMRLCSLGAAALVALALTGCGASDEPEFTPESFIEAMNDHGAALTLGSVLTTNPDGVDVHTVTFAELNPGSEPGSGAPPIDVHGSATLVVPPDDDAALEEYTRCESAPILTCFRAANAVLRVEGLQAADGERITTALNGIEGDGG